MSELAQKILAAATLGGSEQDAISRIDVELKPVREWILWLRKEFGPDKFCRHDGEPVYREGYDNIAPVVQSMLPTIEEMSGLVHDFTDGESMKDYMEELSNG